MVKKRNDPVTNVTGWISGLHAPVREGVYQRSYPSGPAYCRWTTKRGWSWKNDTPRLASVDFSISGTQKLRWRGLTQRAYDQQVAKKCK
jgi:hypothetical protein